jgi:hypothetical protein
MVRFNYFLEEGAFVRDTESGRYRVDFERFGDAISGLSRLLLTLQGDGNYEGAKELTEGKGIISPTLKGDLDRLSEAGIPVDITFIQGVEALEL